MDTTPRTLYSRPTVEVWVATDKLGADADDDLFELVEEAVESAMAALATRLDESPDWGLQVRLDGAIVGSG